MRDDLNKWKDIPHSSIGTLYEFTYRFNTAHIKLPVPSFWRNWQADTKIHMELQETQNNLEKKNEVWNYAKI